VTSAGALLGPDHRAGGLRRLGSKGQGGRKNGLVQRSLCGEDRRGIYVILTQEGLRRHAEAAPVHREVLARILPPSLVECQCTDAVPA
jgi:hypothetical protein